MANMADREIVPKRPLPMESPERRKRCVDALVETLIFGRMEAADGARRLANVFARAETASERRRLAGHFRAFMQERKSPYNAVNGIAAVVDGFIGGMGAAFRFVSWPRWTTTDAQRQLYLFSLVAGFGGRTFGLAKNAVGRAFGIRPRQAEEFVRKAKLYGFLVELPSRQAEPGRWRRMATYMLTAAYQTELNDMQPLMLDAAERLAWIFREPMDADERRRLADEVLSMCV